MKQTDITMLIYPDPMNGYTVWWCTMVQDQESLFTRMELQLEQAQLKWAVVPSPVEMVMCSLAEEILEADMVPGTPAPMWMNSKCTTGSSQRVKYAKCTKHQHSQNFRLMCFILLFFVIMSILYMPIKRLFVSLFLWNI